MSFLLLIPLSIGLGLLGLCAFFWALRNGQFDDPNGAAWRILFPDHPLETEGESDGKLAPDTQDSNP
ncbi:MAG: cbb3-type cytochrome oxidase assembly protein CcoS [Geminicoccaceae bacterium]|nr:cbb3-type cytochrome oxidase assembly protein CcoS [Geminicoccaceae bacterium]